MLPRPQVQYDGLGLLVEAVSVYVQTGGRLDAATWRLVRELADSVAAEETGQNRSRRTASGNSGILRC